MDKVKFSLIGHRHLNICNPVSTAKLDQAISFLGFDSKSRVVDFGAGKCELLVRIVEKYAATGVAVELAGGLISNAEEVIGNRIRREQLQIHLGDAKEFAVRYRETPFDLGVCVGSTHAFGGYHPTLTALRNCVKPGGLLLVGEGYWKRKPDLEYLDFLGCNERDFVSHLENIERAKAIGLVPIWSATTDESESDAYETAYSRSLEDYVVENPLNPDCADILKQIRAWQKAYLQWGRSTLGFGLYLFRNA